MTTFNPYVSKIYRKDKRVDMVTCTEIFRWA